MANHTYKIIDDNFTIELFDGVQTEPYIRQPNWPDGTPWASATEAENWAKQHILSLTDETAELAGISPAQPTLPRPVPVTGVAAIKQKLVMGQPLTEEEADLLLASL